MDQLGRFPWFLLYSPTRAAMCPFSALFLSAWLLGHSSLLQRRCRTVDENDSPIVKLWISKPCGKTDTGKTLYEMTEGKLFFETFREEFWGLPSRTSCMEHLRERASTSCVCCSLLAPGKGDRRVQPLPPATQGARFVRFRSPQLKCCQALLSPVRPVEGRCQLPLQDFCSFFWSRTSRFRIRGTRDNHMIVFIGRCFPAFLCLRISAGFRLVPLYLCLRAL